MTTWGSYNPFSDRVTNITELFFKLLITMLFNSYINPMRQVILRENFSQSRSVISLAIQWLRLCPSNAGGMGSIPDQGTKIPHAMQHGQKKKKNQLTVTLVRITKTVAEMEFEPGSLSLEPWVLHSSPLQPLTYMRYKG